MRCQGCSACICQLHSNLGTFVCGVAGRKNFYLFLLVIAV